MVPNIYCVDKSMYVTRFSASRMANYWPNDEGKRRGILPPEDSGLGLGQTV